jgi:hypothetical protein
VRLLAERAPEAGGSGRVMDQAALLERLSAVAPAGAGQFVARCPAQIPLHDRAGEVVAHALVDLEDFVRLGGFRWSLSSTSDYRRVIRRTAKREGRGQRLVYLRREVMGYGPGDPIVDHVNGDALDNRRANLRPATQAQNGQNRRGAQTNSRSGIRGVSRCKQTGRWKAQAELAGRRVWLGRFDTVAEAEAAVVAWRREHMPFSEAS